mgnify:CR=1 FL=1
MPIDKKVYSIKLTDIAKDTVTNVFESENTNRINFHFQTLKRNEVELKSANFIADIDTEEDGIIETIGLSAQGFKDALKMFKNLP